MVHLPASNANESSAEAIAIIGIGCRFPGGISSTDQFWRLLSNGGNTYGHVPAARWSHYHRRGARFSTAVRQAITGGSYLEAIDRFDAEFFGISPREAALMDPQHRLLLEVTWETFEHAGRPPHRVAGSDTGVFIGTCTSDYGASLLEDLPTIEAWTGIGSASCAVANRISHSYDLRGPSIAVDTACSASLVAVHLACQSLRSGECRSALAGGVNLIITPGQTLTLAAAGALAPDGRSKPFDAAANGYGRGEGVGVLLLKPLADAQRDGDRIMALITGSAINQDGRTNGIMAPSGSAQSHVMERACANAGIDPNSVDYIEAHGTGTLLGDPIEAEAIAAVYGRGRAPEQPCLFGSVKSNIGHLEGAAGVASIIKTAIAIQRAQIPPSLLTTTHSEQIKCSATGLRLATEPAPWPTHDRPRRAGVSAFGYGGTVAHLLLEQPPEAQSPGDRPVEPPSGHCQVFPISAASETALRARAEQLATWLGDSSTEPSLPSIGYTLALRRSPLHHRAAVVACDRDELLDGLQALAAGRTDPRVITGAPADSTAGLVWVFSGHGSQWEGMGSELLRLPAFSNVIDEIEPVMLCEMRTSPRQILADGQLDRIDQIQTMIFAMQVGLAALWRSYGVTPDAVIGHSVGEVAAAVVAGALTVQDGARLICRRSKLLRKVSGQGAMAMVMLPPEEAAQRLGDRTDVVAAIDASPTSCVVAGDPAGIEQIAKQWSDEGLAVRRVDSDVAFHSPQMDTLLPDLMTATADIVHRPYTLRAYSTALPEVRTRPATHPGYWAANLRNRVRLADAVTAALEDGFGHFIEISPHPVVAHSIAEIAEARGQDDVFIGTTLRRNLAEEPTMLGAVGAAHCNGIHVDWTRLHPAGQLVDLPSYPWQGKLLWHDPSPTDFGGHAHDVDAHNLLGQAATVAGSDLRLWSSVLEDANRPYPGSHSVHGVEIVPAAVLVETFGRASRNGDERMDLLAVQMRHPVLTAVRKQIQVIYEPARGELRLASRTPTTAHDDDQAWLLHALASTPKPDQRAPLPASLNDAVAAPMAPIDPDLIRRRLAAVGVPSTGFDWAIDELLFGVDCARARVVVPTCGSDHSAWPPVLDALFSIAPVVLAGQSVLRMIDHIESITLIGNPPQQLLIDIQAEPDLPDTLDALIADTNGAVLGRATGLRYPAVDWNSPSPGDAHPSDTTIAQVPAVPDLPAEQLHDWVRDAVTGHIAMEMGLSPAEVDPRRPLLQHGLDSVMTVTIRRKLEKQFGQRLEPAVFWQQPNVESITTHLVSLIAT